MSPQSVEQCIIFPLKCAYRLQLRHINAQKCKVNWVAVFEKDSQCEKISWDLNPEPTSVHKPWYHGGMQIFRIRNRWWSIFTCHAHSTSLQESFRSCSCFSKCISNILLSAVLLCRWLFERLPFDLVHVGCVSGSLEFLSCKTLDNRGPRFTRSMRKKNFTIG